LSSFASQDSGVAEWSLTHCIGLFQVIGILLFLTHLAHTITHTIAHTVSHPALSHPRHLEMALACAIACTASHPMPSPMLLPTPPPAPCHPCTISHPTPSHLLHRPRHLTCAIACTISHAISTPPFRTPQGYSIILCSYNTIPYVDYNIIDKTSPKRENKNKKTKRVHVEMKNNEIPIWVYRYLQCCPKPAGLQCGYR